MLALTHILVCLLPLTAETEGILDAQLFAGLPRGAMLLNAGRGAACRSSRTSCRRSTAASSRRRCSTSLRKEPLPDDHPFWRDERIHVTPGTSPTSANPTRGAGGGRHLPPGARRGAPRERCRPERRLLNRREQLRRFSPATRKAG